MRPRAPSRACASTTGVDVRSLRRDGDRTFTRDAAGTEHGPFDLVIIADGSVSELRASRGRDHA